MSLLIIIFNSKVKQVKAVELLLLMQGYLNQLKENAMSDSTKEVRDSC